MTDLSKSTEQKHHKFLATEYFKFECLCKIMEELSYEVRGEAEPKSGLAEKSEQLEYLAITIKDLLVRAEADFLNAIDTYDRVEEEEDFDYFINLYSFLKESDKKDLIKRVIIGTEKQELGNRSYNIRRVLAKKYGVKIKKDPKQAIIFLKEDLE